VVRWRGNPLLPEVGEAGNERESQLLMGGERGGEEKKFGKGGFLGGGVQSYQRKGDGS